MMFDVRWGGEARDVLELPLCLLHASVMLHTESPLHPFHFPLSISISRIRGLPNRPIRIKDGSRIVHDGFWKRYEWKMVSIVSKSEVIGISSNGIHGDILTFVE